MKPSLDILLEFQMLVDDIGDVTITNDGATILKLLEIEHPAAKVRVNRQDLDHIRIIFRIWTRHRI